jgi:NADH-quinone oxidoreductase subunit G
VVGAVAKAKNVAAPAGFDKVDSHERFDAAAASLSAANADTPAVILLGNSALFHPQASQIHAAAEWLAATTGAKLGYLVDAANTIGGHIAGATSKNAGSIFSSPKKAYVLLNAEPELDCANPQEAVAALQGAEMVVAMSAFRHGLDYADVLLPIAPFSETAGTFINCEGRVQSFNGTVKPLGDARPAWKVLRVLGNLLGLSGFDYDTSEAIRDEVLGKGVTDVSAKLNNLSAAAPVAAVFAKDAGTGLQRLADVPIYFADAIARRSPPLLRTADAQAPLCHLPRALAEMLDVKNGDMVKVTQGSGSAVLAANIDAGLPANTVRVAASHPATAMLGAMFGPIDVVKAESFKAGEGA